MKAIVKSLIAVAIVASFSMNAMADDDEHDHEQAGEGRYQQSDDQYADSRDDRRDEYQRMDPSEREDMRRDMRRDREDGSRDDREERRREMRDRFDSMTPEERRELREEMRHRSHLGYGPYSSLGNRGNARIVLGDGLALQQLEFMLGF